jgi:hypothetical protein
MIDYMMMDVRALFAVGGTMFEKIAACVIVSMSISTVTSQVVAAESKSESEALFMQMHSVLTHPRCLNCHPKGDSPKQGDQARLHVPSMTRGPRDNGPAGMHCDTCHQKANFPASGVPGAPTWHLAPLSMAWENKTPGEICRQMLDRRRNGNKSLAQIVHHLTEDALVAWGWSPGVDVTGKARDPVPIAKPEFNRIVHAWAKSGASGPK